MNDTDWINKLKEKRTQYGVSQNRLAVMAGVSREYVSRVESGKVALTEEIKGKFTDALEKLNPENPLEMVLDYVRIRFPTQDIRHVIEDILQLKLDVMIHEDYGFYSYAEHYVLGDVFVLASPDKEKGTFDHNDYESKQMQQYVYDCDLLIVDDLGTELANAFTASQFFTCINERLLNMKSTVVSTNLSLDSLADLYTERSFSRITSNYILLRLFGDDIRIIKKIRANREGK